MKKNLTVGLKPVGIGKVALIGVDKVGQAATLGYALIDPKLAENIDENASYKVDIIYMYNLEEKTTKIHIKNFVQTATDVARTPLYTIIATEAKVLKVVDNNDNYATLLCKLDDGSSVAAEAWHRNNQGKVSQLKDNDTWKMSLTLGGLYDERNKINAFLKTSTSHSAATTTAAVEPPVANEPTQPVVKEFDFNHLKKELKAPIPISLYV